MPASKKLTQLPQGSPSQSSAPHDLSMHVMPTPPGSRSKSPLPPSQSGSVPSEGLSRTPSTSELKNSKGLRAKSPLPPSQSGSVPSGGLPRTPSTSELKNSKGLHTTPTTALGNQSRTPAPMESRSLTGSDCGSASRTSARASSSNSKFQHFTLTNT